MRSDPRKAIPLQDGTRFTRIIPALPSAAMPHRSTIHVRAYDPIRTPLVQRVRLIWYATFHRVGTCRVGDAPVRIGLLQKRGERA